MMTSPTSEVTMAPNAAPMMTPTARSTTLPFIANSRNSLSTRNLFFSTPPTGSTTAEPTASVEQPGMHHGAADRGARRFRHRHHRQAQLLVHLAEQRHRIFDRRGVAFDEQVGVQRHQLVVHFQRRGDVALLPGGVE